MDTCADIQSAATTFRKAAIAGALAFLVSLAFTRIAFRETDPFRPLDSKVGINSRNPVKLIELVTTQDKEPFRTANSSTEHERFGIRHLALVRLVEIQETYFGSVPTPPSTHGVGIDHPYIRLRSLSSDCVVIEGTPNLEPTSFDQTSLGDPSGYWLVERLTFTRSGKLLDRQPVLTDLDSD